MNQKNNYMWNELIGSIGAYDYKELPLYITCSVCQKKYQKVNIQNMKVNIIVLNVLQNF